MSEEDIEWEYEARPFTTDGEVWAGRSVEAARDLVAEYADRNHWVYKNNDLAPVVGFTLHRRRKAGPWESADGGDA